MKDARVLSCFFGRAFKNVYPAPEGYDSYFSSYIRELIFGGSSIDGAKLSSFSAIKKCLYRLEQISNLITWK